LTHAKPYHLLEKLTNQPVKPEKSDEFWGYITCSLMLDERRNLILDDLQ